MSLSEAREYTQSVVLITALSCQRSTLGGQHVFLLLVLTHQSLLHRSGQTQHIYLQNKHREGLLCTGRVQAHLTPFILQHKQQ